MMEPASDLSAFDELYRRHADAVYRFCLSQVRDAAIAEDIAADAFAAAFISYERVRPATEGVRPWLFRIARNAAVDHHRRQRRWFRLFASQPLPPPAPGVEARAEIRGRLRQVVEALARLSARDRELLGLRLAAGLSFAEIAAAVGGKETAARVATHRALGRLRREIEAMEDAS